MLPLVKDHVLKEQVEMELAAALLDGVDYLVTVIFQNVEIFSENIPRVIRIKKMLVFVIGIGI